MGTLTRPGTVLVLVDLQEWITALPLAPLSGPEVVTECAALLDTFRKAGEPVVFVRYLREDGADGGADHPETRLVDGVLPTAGEETVVKHGLDAFQGATASGLGLHALLRTYGADSVVLAGIATPHGIAATATTALRLGYRAVIPTDATTAGDAHGHTTALRELASAGAELLPLSRILEALG